MQIRPSIAIIGGGPGGLTLARLLWLSGIEATIFERDEHALARPQGGTLDLHRDGGLLALERAGLMAQFAAYARPEDQESRIYDPRGVLHLAQTDVADHDRPEIDRTHLRALLLDGLPPGWVRWDSRVRAITAVGDGRLRVDGADGALGDFDLVVGADGAWSVVRPLVSSAQPAYSGVTFFELSIEDVDSRHPEIARFVGHGKASVHGDDGRGLFAQRNSGGQVRVYVSFRVPAGWLSSGAVDLSSAGRTKADLRRLLGDWAPSVLTLIDCASDVIVPRPLSALPIGHRFPHRRGVTLLGDAAHVMSPFGGDGVNLAMADALDLADALARSLGPAGDGDWDAAVAAYEESMCARATPAAMGAAQGLEAFSGEGSLARAVAFFSSHAAGPPPAPSGT